jgi:hypothetical protein
MKSIGTWGFAMTLNRRDFVELGSAAALLTALGLPALAADAPTVGLIFPLDLGVRVLDHLL